MHSFLSLGLNPEIARALDSFGFTQPTEIQSLSASAILGAKDAYISSATGSGKTFAYLAPILSMLDPASNETGAIIIAPTHDLAAQLFRETNRLVAASGLGFRTAQALGSISLQRQREQLQTQPHVIIGSAGRLRDLVESRYIDIRQCRYVVMDEGDRLFEKEVVEISSDLLNRLPETCSRVLVSATIPEKIIGRTASWFRDAEKLFLDSTESLRSSIEHWCFHAPSRKKSDFLRRFEVAVKPERCLLFVSSNAMLHSVAEKLEHFGIQYAELKATQAGNERKSALHMFADGEVRWLLTTDLGARGLDIADISHVISYDLPEEPSIYVHRAGRTGRAGQHGISVAITDMVELKRASKIAVRYNFPFICKILDSGHVYDIEPENFFALAEEAESHKQQPADNLTPVSRFANNRMRSSGVRSSNSATEQNRGQMRGADKGRLRPPARMRTESNGPAKPMRTDGKPMPADKTAAIGTDKRRPKSKRADSGQSKRGTPPSITGRPDNAGTPGSSANHAQPGNAAGAPSAPQHPAGRAAPAKNKPGRPSPRPKTGRRPRPAASSSSDSAPDTSGS